MSIKVILSKIVNGESLTEEEKKIIADYDPENDESRIPKTRLNQKISELKEANERADSLDKKVRELEDEIEELKNQNLSDADKNKAAQEKELNKLKSQIDSLTKERDEARSSLERSERSVRIAEIASKHGFADKGYLDYLTSSKGIDLNDDGAISSFMKELSSGSPELFRSTAKPGGGTSGSDAAKGATDCEQRIKELMAKPSLSASEASEVISLQGKISQTSNNGDAK